MDEKIKIAITKQDNESEKAENIGKKRVKKNKNKNWDDMAQSMQDFIISLKQNSDLFLPEDSYKKLEMYKKTYDRLLYTVLSDEIFSCFDDETKIKEGTNILTNIDALLVYCENNENYQKNVHNIILKLKDHANLASRQYNSLKQTDEEYQQKFNKRIFGFKEKVTQEMAAQLITLVGIFTAIAFVVFGGLSSLESIFSNKRPLIEIIVIASIWMLGMINLVFIFLKGISNMTQLDISSKNSDNLLEKYIWIIWFNLIFILIIISVFWINFAKNSIILNNLFTKWKEWIYVGGTFLLIILIIITICFLINNTKSIKTKSSKIKAPQVK